MNLTSISADDVTVTVPVEMHHLVRSGAVKMKVKRPEVRFLVATYMIKHREQNTYWCPQWQGWGHITQATQFVQAERDSIELPPDGEWIDLGLNEISFTTN